MTNKEKFYNLCKGITRDGIDKLLAYLETTDFFRAPASTKYHSSVPEGLIIHSMSVYNCLVNLQGNLKFDTRNNESLLIVALFHDVCKINYYIESTRNVKENGAWVQKPYYAYNNEKISYGHGEESVLILSRFLKLTMEETFAIRYHMGAYNHSEMPNLQNVYRKYPLAFYTHIADNQSNLYCESQEGFKNEK